MIPAPNEAELFAKIKARREWMATMDPEYAEWARGNYKRILAVFFVRGSNE